MRGKSIKQGGSRVEARGEMETNPEAHVPRREDAKSQCKNELTWVVDGAGGRRTASGC